MTTRAVLLAGGKGERLYPITREIPKAMIPVHGKPLIEHSVHLYWKYQVWELWLSLSNYKFKPIVDKYPYPVIFEQEPMGTGGWLKLVKNDEGLLQTFTQEDFHVNNVDNLLNVDLTKMMEQHKRQKNIVTIACVKVPDTRAYGEVAIKHQDRITKFKEKAQSPKPKQGYISTGYYIFSPEIFDYIPEVEGPVSLEKDIFPKIARMNKMGAFIPKFEESIQWFDTGTMERYDKVLNEWKGV